MIRKTLTILSLVGLVASTALCGFSYFGLHYQRLVISEGGGSQWNTYIHVVDGVAVFHRGHQERAGFHDSNCSETFDTRWQIPSDWLPAFVRKRHQFIPACHVEGEITQWPDGLDGSRWGYIVVPLYSLIILTAACPAYCLTPGYRRRRRRKLGLCIACGYDLRGSTDHCPECNSPIG